MLFVGDGGVRVVYAVPEGVAESNAHQQVNRWHVARGISYLFNPGSVGQPRRHTSQPSRPTRETDRDFVVGEEDRRAAYMLLYRDQRGDVHYQWRRVEYDEEETTKQFAQPGLAERHLEGRPGAAAVIEHDAPELDPLTDEEMARVMAELPATAEKLAKMLE